MTGSRTPTIIAVTALVVATLAATPIGQAAGRLVLPASSVGPAQLKKNAVTGPKVRNGSLMAADFKTGQLPAGPQGPNGDPGPQGPRGETGAAGSPGLSDVETVEVWSANDSNSPKEVFVYCPAGKRVIGTGAHTPGGWAGWPIAVADITNLGTNAVHIVAFETAATSNNWQITGQAICATVA